MAQTIDFKRITTHADNVYEAIIMSSRRARQINTEQRIALERELGYDDNDDFDDEDFEDGQSANVIEYPKASTQALEEFLRGDLKKNYIEDEEK